MPRRASALLQPVLRMTLLLALILLAVNGPLRAQIDGQAGGQPPAKQPVDAAAASTDQDDSMITLILNSGLTGIGFMVVLDCSRWAP